LVAASDCAPRSQPEAVVVPRKFVWRRRLAFREPAARAGRTSNIGMGWRSRWSRTLAEVVASVFWAASPLSLFVRKSLHHTVIPAEAGIQSSR